MGSEPSRYVRNPEATTALCYHLYNTYGTQDGIDDILETYRIDPNEKLQTFGDSPFLGYRYPLMIAIASFENRRNKTGMVRSLLQHGARVNITEHRNSPLTLALKTEWRPDIPEMLMEHGAPFDAEDPRMRQTIRQVIRSGKHDLLQWLFEHCGLALPRRETDQLVRSLDADIQQDRDDELRQRKRKTRQLLLKMRDYDLVQQVLLNRQKTGRRQNAEAQGSGATRGGAQQNRHVQKMHKMHKTVKDQEGQQQQQRRALAQFLSSPSKIPDELVAELLSGLTHGDAKEITAAAKKMRGLKTGS